MRPDHATPSRSRPSRRGFLRGALALLAAGPAALIAACTPGRESASPRPASSPVASGSLPTTVPTVPPSPADAAAALRRAIGRMLMIGFRGTAFDAADPILQAVASGELGSVILFDRDHLTKTAGRNITDPTQLAALTTALHAAYPAEAGSRFLIALDQEGGLVVRLNSTDGYAATESEAALGAANDLTHTTAVATVTATWLAEAGIDLNLAPVVDLDVDPASPAIGALDRSFSKDPAVVVAQATAVIDAHHAKGVLCAIKHFPGEGSATGNTDDGVVDVTATWTEAELAPFASLVDAGLPDAIMVGNVIDTKIDPSRPLSLSPAAVTGLLRKRLGWDGVVVTDDLQAGAIRARYGVEEAAILAIEAGADLLIFANQQEFDPTVVARVTGAVVAAVGSGRIDAAWIAASVARIETMLAGGH